jgi:hypothetical protein
MQCIQGQGPDSGGICIYLTQLVVEESPGLKLQSLPNFKAPAKRFWPFAILFV